MRVFFAKPSSSLYPLCPHATCPRPSQNPAPPMEHAACSPTSPRRRGTPTFPSQSELPLHPHRSLASRSPSDPDKTPAPPPPPLEHASAARLTEPDTPPSA